MTDEDTTEVTPDSLMDQFKGKGIKPILIFTIIVHVVLVFGSSVPFFIRSVMKPDNSELSEAERVKSAVADATSALRKIAKKHGLNPEDVSSQFAGGGSRTRKASADAAAAPADAVNTAPDDKSAFETNLEAKADGPTVPSFDDEQDDIF